MQSNGMGHAWNIGPRSDKCRVMEMVMSGLPGMP